MDLSASPVLAVRFGAQTHYLASALLTPNGMELPAHHSPAPVVKSSTPQQVHVPAPQVHSGLDLPAPLAPMDLSGIA